MKQTTNASHDPQRRSVRWICPFQRKPNPSRDPTRMALKMRKLLSILRERR